MYGGILDKYDYIAEINSMALTKRQKVNATTDAKRHDTDTGSPEYQVALFTSRINKLTGHLKKNQHDFHSRRGLLKMVAKRKKLLDYLARTDEKAYKKIVKQLGLRERK